MSQNYSTWYYYYLAQVPHYYGEKTYDVMVVTQLCLNNEEEELFRPTVLCQMRNLENAQKLVHELNKVKGSSYELILRDMISKNQEGI